MKKHLSNCRVSLNKLPPFWNRRVLFLSNIFALFFENQTQIRALRNQVGALETYGGRMIPILNLLFQKKGNLLALESPPDADLIPYLKSIGLSLPDLDVLPRDFEHKFINKDKSIKPFVERLKKHNSDYIMGYVTDDPLVQLAKQINKKTIGTFDGCYKGNNKGLLQKFLEKSGLPIFDTYEAKTPKEISMYLDKLAEKGYHFAVIKSQIGASGIGMTKIDLSANRKKHPPNYLFHEGSALVQGWLDDQVSGVTRIASPSVLLFVDQDSCWIYDMTEQILSHESVHEGNVSPPPFLDDYPQVKDELISQAEKCGAWLIEQGYEGTASIDYHVVKRKEKIEVRVCEINARVTGATYPSLLAKNLVPHHHWLLRNIKFSPALKGSKILDVLRKNKLLFTREKGEGALPFNFNTHKDGKVAKAQFLFLAPKRAKVYTYLKQVGQKLAAKGQFDRD